MIALYSYAYDSRNRLTQITGPDGSVQKRYMYDLKGNVTKVIGAWGMSGGESDGERPGELYTYNCQRWLTESRIPVKEEEGEVKYRLTRYSYDAAGNLTEEKHYRDYQGITGAAGAVHTISYRYDADNRLVRVSDCTGAVLEYRYDALNRCISEKQKDK